ALNKERAEEIAPFVQKLQAVEGDRKVRIEAFPNVVRDGLLAAPAAPPPPLPPAGVAAGQFAAIADERVLELPLADNVFLRQMPNLTIREYAHTLRPNWTEGSRADFSETVYWNAGIKTNPSTGIATVSFNLSDSVTSFSVLADAFAQNGTLGSNVSQVESVQPFSIEPKVPLQVTSGDVVQLPIGVINGMNRDLRGAEVKADATGGLKFTMLGDRSTTLHSKERARRLLQ